MYFCEFDPPRKRRVTFLLVQKSNQRTRQGDAPWNPGLANSLRLEQSSPRTRDGR
ncbi:MAG: YjbQ family protein [Oscillospiraceae bacterium]|nr:YjbQ family protein [Oscillospiraceae bacterium]